MSPVAQRSFNLLCVYQPGSSLTVCVCACTCVRACSPVPFKLQEGAVRIISMSQCQSYFDMKTITPRMLCAGYDAGTVDSCMVTLCCCSCGSAVCVAVCVGVADSVRLSRATAAARWCARRTAPAGRSSA